MNTEKTPILPLKSISDNNCFIKREDLIPYSFGGNKARKAAIFFNEIDKGGYDCVVTYGSSSSNHCRVVSNMAAQRNMPCYIISPEESSEQTFNSKLMTIFGAEITVVPVNSVHDTIENIIAKLRTEGENPYFIPGGGHGNIGTQAYVDCYEEIREYEKENGISFDYVFLASGTGTTQAGLVCGKLIHGDKKHIVGISIARKCPRGREIVIDSINEYLAAAGKEIEKEIINNATIFDDGYIADGYGQNDEDILSTIRSVMMSEGIPLDATYTGKAFYGMKNWLEKNGVKGKNVLFIHTGGTPLFFDYLRI